MIIKLKRFSKKEDEKLTVSDGLNIVDGALTTGAVGSIALGGGQRLGSRVKGLKHKVNVSKESIAGLLKKGKIKDAGKFIQEGLSSQDIKLLNKSHKSIRRGGKLALGAAGVGLASNMAEKLEKKNKSKK